ncbi:RagB/SusD family nutrient uptake outer membrane protein [Cyclobacterium sp. 1_MG-2023]|uniref:RagB/SusD family nutrient uptake outer membrane protein n=1 Tax=Cyclobacterium sp. 1_MG-2023 TaxID=3062681 RepID=UPI0026E2E1D4|nr:RagB/SusD family nutrient uptake outer membrane protein [Cyclobacterium sp. 1_MG-2023]MDO6438998.1 RagB/SusD family nutrient uptake outer membrane protein [Cyclobacterium sp. 1_MG-2023]
MKYFNKRYWLLVMLISCSLFGCQDYLELEDNTSISAGSFPTTLEHVDLLVASTYGVQHDWGFLGHYWHGYGIFCFDHTIDFQWKGTESWIGMSIGMAELGDSKLVNEWRDLYRGIYYSNSALEGIRSYRSIAPESEFERLDQYEGEALFMRGFYLWHLQVFYGQPNLDGMGVPVITEVPGSLESMSVGRSSTMETYQAMIEDFKNASILLEGQLDNHRATEWSAKAALAKVYLFAEKYDSAKEVLEDCINNSGKSLVPFDHYKNMFNGDTQYEYNSESFYEVGNRAEPEKTNNNGSRVQNTGSSVTILYTPFYIDSNNERSAMGYSNQYTHDKNLKRFGYNDPAPLTQIEEVNGEYKLLDSYVSQQMDRRANAGRQADGPDPRLYVSTLQPFFDSVKVSGVEYPVAQAEFGKWWQMSPTTGIDPDTFYGWPLKKNQFLGGTIWETRAVNGANFYFIRLPDIYLMYAEVIKDSNPTLALEYINKVHRRAYGYDPDSPSPVDYVSLTDNTLAPADDHLSNNPLLYERWAEFFGEAKWWEDIRRLRLGDEESDFYKSVASGRQIVWRDEHYAMPIPPLEFESNTSDELIQNPGY